MSMNQEMLVHTIAPAAYEAPVAPTGTAAAARARLVLAGTVTKR